MKKILFCGGGSAGHVTPNIAIIEDVKKYYDVCYAGTDGIEKDICKQNGVEFYQFKTEKFVRGKFFCNLLLPIKLFRSVSSVKKLLIEIKPNLVFCKGGYVCVPVAMAARKLKIPVITHESDIAAGLANKFISRYCKTVLTAFPSTANAFYNGKFVGTPMRSSLFNRSKIEAKKYFGFDMRPTVLFFGGGSGSKIINENLIKIIKELCTEVNVLHITGKQFSFNQKIHGYKKISYCEDMGLAYACADMAVARCGANSAAELTALKIPTLFIPLENKRSRGDQVKNAEYFKTLGTCKVLAESELNSTALKNSIYEVLYSDNIKKALNSINFKSANAKIIYEIEKNI